jgi:NTP pyrophosphatase (non-canonical NTP hydrolase)
MTPTDRLEAVLAEIRAERARQDAKWGEQNHNALVWLLIALEELGEAAEHIEATNYLSTSLMAANLTSWGEWAKKKLHTLQWETGAPFIGSVEVGDPASLRKELMQLAAVAVAIIESLDRQGVTA